MNGNISGSKYTVGLMERPHAFTELVVWMQHLGSKVTHITATRYLNKLLDQKILMKRKLWKENYYINMELFALFSNINAQQ